MRGEKLADNISFNVPDPNGRAMRGTLSTHRAGVGMNDSFSSVLFFDGDEFELTAQEREIIESLEQIVHNATDAINNANRAAAKMAMRRYLAAKKPE